MGNSWSKAPIDGETWGLNGIILRRPVKRMFLMHDLDFFLNGKSGESLQHVYEDIVAETKRRGVPVMTLRKYKRLPNSVEFPRDKMHYNYFTSSMAYMIAYAIYKGATSIDLYGVGLVKELEYREQKACIEYWLGYARGLGIKWCVHGLTTLFSHMGHAGSYGYEWTKQYQKIP